LAKKPEHRFHSAGELARAVSVVANQPVSRSASQRSASQSVSQSASQRSASQPVSQSASQRPASQPISQSASQRYENKPTVMNTPPGVVSRPASQPMSQPITKPPQSIPWGWLVGATMLGLIGCGLILAMGLWLNRNNGAAVATMPTATSQPINTPMPNPTATQIAQAENIPTPESAVQPAAKAKPIEMPGSDPILTNPLNGTTLTQGNNTKPIEVLRWEGRELGAEEQFVVTIRNPNGKNIEFPDQGITQKNEYPLPLGLIGGQYSWLVVVQQKTAMGDFKDVNRSAINTFKVVSINNNNSDSKPPVENTPVAYSVTRPKIDLIAPRTGDSFVGKEAVFELQWNESSPALAADEYYVLIINHKGGEDRTWLKTNHYSLPKEKDWLIGMGPDLRWQVVIAQKRTSDPNEDPRGAERSEWGQERKFSWAVPVAGSKSSKDNGGSGGSGGGPTTSD